MLKTRKLGLSLIEIIVVVVLLGLIALLVVPRFVGVTSYARQNVLESILNDVRTIIYEHNAKSSFGLVATFDPTVTDLNNAYANGFPASPFNNSRNICYTEIGSDATSRRTIGINWGFPVATATCSAYSISPSEPVGWIYYDGAPYNGLVAAAFWANSAYDFDGTTANLF